MEELPYALDIGEAADVEFGSALDEDPEVQETLELFIRAQTEEALARAKALRQAGKLDKRLLSVETRSLHQLKRLEEAGHAAVALVGVEDEDEDEDDASLLWLARDILRAAHAERAAELVGVRVRRFPPARAHILDEENCLGELRPLL